MVTLLDDEFIVDFNGFTLNFTLIYTYISDPPIFADIGASNMIINDMDLYMDASPILINNTLNIAIDSLNISLDALSFELDGISDISIVMTDFLNTTLNIVFNRLKSIINYKLKSNFEPLLNEFFHLIPNRFPIPGTDLEAVINLYTNLTISNRS